MIFAAGPAASAAAVKAATDPVTEAFGPDAIHHHFAGGVYAKETRIPAGGFVVSHSHPFDHMSILASGRVELLRDYGREIEILTGPAAVTITKGQAHKVTALTDAVWYCIHATDETEADLVDAAILAKEP
jgi:hypothetical protein